MNLKIIEPWTRIEDAPEGEELLRRIERIGRVCYKSEGSITEASARGFVERLLARGHESVIEHVSLSARIVCDRGVSHEIVRHRIASYSQESTRYCNYSQDKFDGQLSFIRPCFWAEGSEAYRLWASAMAEAERAYLSLLDAGASPQEARSVLPSSVKTELAATMNLREWRHFFRLRTSPAAHPQMRQVAGMLLEQMREAVPVIFDTL